MTDDRQTDRQTTYCTKGTTDSTVGQKAVGISQSYMQVNSINFFELTAASSQFFGTTLSSTFRSEQESNPSHHWCQFIAISLMRLTDTVNASSRHTLL